MREGRPRAVRFRPLPLAAKVGAAVVCIAAFSGGCATEVNTLDNTDVVAGETGNDVVVPVPTGGKTSSGGSVSTGGAAGTKTVNAFGGTATTGGKTSTGGATATAGTAGTGAGGDAKGGASNGGSGGAAAGSKNGGAGGGGAGGNANGGSGGNASGGAGGSGGGSGGSLACLKNWPGDKCDTCSTQTQSDKLACVDILNCYAANSCGPSTCGNNDDKCGANKIGKGTAGFPIASDVYQCLCK